MAKPSNKSLKIDNIGFEQLDIDTLILYKQKVEIIIRHKQNKQKQELKKRLQTKAAKLGIDLKQYFTESSLALKKPQSTVRKKYIYKGIKWSGRGRCPKVFQQYFISGGNKADLLIEKQ
ncbi:MAG: H-NS histone family protein [Magnetococcales bacterium]|nr:H-NS histone family protein [Magnetococcales bacterium]